MKILFNDGHTGECPAEKEVEVLRHSAAHIMAQAVKRLYPQAHFGYGPATEKGFRQIKKSSAILTKAYLNLQRI